MGQTYPRVFLRKDRGHVYYYHWTVDGKDKILSTGISTKERAQKEVERRVDEAARAAKEPAASILTFRQYAERYYRWPEGGAPTCPHASRLLAEGKQIGRQHCLASRRLLDRVLEAVPGFGDLPLGEIRRSAVVDLRTRLMEKFNANTSGKMLESVKTVLSEAAFREDIESNPGAEVGKPSYEPRVRAALTVAEVRGILETCPGRMATEPRIKTMMVVLLGTGVRAGELRALRWGAVDLDTREAVIREAAKGERGVETGPPKWGRVRRIVLPEFVAASLREWRGIAVRTDAADFIFGGADGRIPSHQVVKDAWTSVLAGSTIAVGDRWLTPHSCRHTLNSALLLAGASPLGVAEFLGWSSDAGRALSRVQADYTHLHMLDLRRVADLVDTLYTGKAASGEVRALRVVG